MTTPTCLQKPFNVYGVPVSVDVQASVWLRMQLTPFFQARDVEGFFADLPKTPRGQDVRVRAADRILQKLRKDSHIEFTGGHWKVKA